MRRALLRNICRINEEKAKSFLQRCCSPLEDLKVYKYIACDSQAVGREFESRCPLQIIQAFRRLCRKAFFCDRSHNIQQFKSNKVLALAIQ